MQDTDPSAGSARRRHSVPLGAHPRVRQCIQFWALPRYGLRNLSTRMRHGAR